MKLGVAVRMRGRKVQNSDNTTSPLLYFAIFLHHGGTTECFIASETARR